MSLMTSPGVRAGDGATPLDGAGGVGVAAGSAGRARPAGGNGALTTAGVLVAAAKAGLAGAGAAPLNIGAGCEPDCRNRTLTRIATTAAVPNTTATAARGLQPSARNRLPPASPASSAAAFPRPVRAPRLRTFLHRNVGRHVDRARHQAPDRGLSDPDLAAMADRRAIERQMEGDARALAEAALNLELAAVQRKQSLDYGDAEPGAVVTAVIARARLEERLADAGQILDADADAVVLDRDRDDGILQ